MEVGGLAQGEHDLGEMERAMQASMLLGNIMKLMT